MGCNVSKDGKESTKEKDGSNHASATSKSSGGSSKKAKAKAIENGGTTTANGVNVNDDHQSDGHAPTIIEDEQSGDADAGKEVDEVIDIDCEDPEVQEAATKIQAAFRGSQARKNLKMQESPKAGDQSPIEDIDPNDPEVNKAAAKIQASFRGHKVRKEMKKQGDDKKSPTNPSSHQ